MPNLYFDENGNRVKGRYIYRKATGNYYAMCKYPEGFSKTKQFSTFEEAVSFIRDEWDTYALGWYFNNDLELVVLKRPAELKGC